MCRVLPWAMAMLILWILRSVVLSGYMIYPFPYFSIDVPWKLSAQTAYNERAAITGWARMPGPEYMKAVTEGLGYWLKPYLLRNAVKLLSCIQLFIVTATLWICIADKSKKEFLPVQAHVTTNSILFKFFRYLFFMSSP